MNIIDKVIELEAGEIDCKDDMEDGTIIIKDGILNFDFCGIKFTGHDALEDHLKFTIGASDYYIVGYISAIRRKIEDDKILGRVS